jgi:hypothetical protein
VSQSYKAALLGAAYAGASLERICMRPTIAFLLATTTSLVAHAAPAASDLAWLSGDWHRCKDGEIVEERWLGPRGEMLLGANLTTSRSGKASYESLRIARGDDTWIYWASPMGRAPVPFRMVESSAEHVAFTNPEHDFPARISYWRDGVDLLAKIEGTVKDQRVATEWRFAPGAATDCPQPP